MKLSQYHQCLDLLHLGMTLDEIQEQTQLPISEVILIEGGARIAPYVLLQNTGEYETCPCCGRKVQLPCYFCFLKDHPGVWCVEVVARPARNKDMPIPVSLDVQLLS